MSQKKKVKVKKKKVKVKKQKVKKPPGPGILTLVMGKFSTYVKEEVQEIKQELKAKNLFKPIKDGFGSILKGASHVKEQISGDISLEDDTLAIPKGTQRSGDSGGPRSNQDEELQTVVDEQKQTEEFGSAFEKLGSMRQRDSRKTPAADTEEAGVDPGTPELEPSTISSEEVPTPGGSTEAVPLGEEPGVESIGEPESADSVPLAQKTEDDQMGKAMEQLGSMADRDAKRKEKEPEAAAMLQESPPDVQTETSAPPTQESDSEPAPPSEEPTEDVASSAVQSETGTSDEAPQPQGEAAPQPQSEKSPPTQQPTGKPAKMMRRKGAAAPRKSNKTELYIKSIKALQVLFGNQMWRGIIVDPEQDPKQLYTPRSAFEERFAEPEFRNAMKAATRVVVGFGGQIRELRFDERTIADAMGFPFPKVGAIENPDERQIAEKCDKKMSKRIEQFALSDEVKRLLMHTGSRLGTFVPGIEIIARIYLGLKKGD